MDRTNGMQVFISHAHSDAGLARQLSQQLETQGFQVFDPAVELLPGDNWHLETGKALEASNAMVVLISPEAARSQSVQGEIQYALGSERFKGRLIPVEVEPTQDFPWILRRLRWIKIESDLAEAGQRLARILQAMREPDLHAGAH
jgi:hypothetical protein